MIPKNDSLVELHHPSSDRATLFPIGRRERAVVVNETMRVSSRLRIVDDEGSGKRGF
jgi:hypothetical protein